MKTAFGLLFGVTVGVASFAFAGTRTPVDFVETSGSQYLILDYTPCSNTVVETKVDVRKTDANAAIFCARGNSTSVRTYTLFSIAGNDGWRFDYNNINNATSKVKPVMGTPVVLKTTPEGLYIDGVRKTTLTPANFVAKNPMMLFASHQSDTPPTAATTRSNPAYVRLYYLKAWEGETLKLDLQPFRNEKGVFGLYDAVADREWYPATPFGGGLPGTTLTDDPAVLDGSVNRTFSGTVSGTGSNKLLVTGSGTTIFEQGVADFGSVEIGGGLVQHEGTSGTALWDDDLTISRGRFRYQPPPSQNGEVSVATNGTITYGPTAEIQLHRSNLYSYLNLGALQRGAGGTLLFTLLTDTNTGDMLGQWLKFKPAGFAGGEVLPPSVAVGRVNAGDSGKYRQLRFAKYDAEKGIVPADMVEGLGTTEQISHLSSSTTVSEDTAVGRLVIDGAATKVTIATNKTLTVGTGTEPTGLMIGETSDNTNGEPFAGGGSVDFGPREGLVWLASGSGKYTYFYGDRVSFKGTGGVTFAGRASGFGSARYPIFRLPNSGTFAQWTGPTRLCGVCYYMDGANSIPHAADSGDLYIEGNQTYGASLHTPGGFTFNNHLHLSGVGLTEKYRAVWSDGQYTFNGPVTMEDDAIVYVQNRWTALGCNQVIDGPGGFGITTAADGSGYASFTKTNTYAGATRMFNNAAVKVNAKATLGQGPVIMDYGRLVLEANPGYVITNAISGPEKGRIHLNKADIKFTSPVDVLAVEGKEDGGTASSGIFRFTDSVRIGSACNSGFLSLVAAGPNAKLELTGDADYTSTLDVAVEDGASLAFSKTGSAAVTVSAAAPCATVDVKEGSLVLQDGSAILKDTASISYWLDASDATTLTYDETTKHTTEWRSKVGDGTFKTVYSSGEIYPHYDSTVNGLKALRFWRHTETSQRMKMADFDHSFTHRTTFVVARPTSTYDWMCVMGNCTTDDKDASPAFRFRDDGEVSCGGLIQGTGYLRIDGLQTCVERAPFAVGETHVFTAEMTANSTFTAAVGGYFTNRDFIGDICEVIEFNRALDNAERKYVEAYLAKKWGVAGVHGDGAMLQGSALTVAAGATLDLNGHSAVVTSLDGTGSIVNSSATPVKLKVKAHGKFKGTVGPGVTVEFKKGLMLIVR